MNGKLIKIGTFKSISTVERGASNITSTLSQDNLKNIHPNNIQVLGFTINPGSSDKVKHAYLTLIFINVNVIICQNLSLFLVSYSQ